jgi:hypothetical protein
MFRSDVLSANRRCYNGVAVLLVCSLVACSEPSQKPDPLERLLTMEIVIHPLGHPETTQQQIRSIRLWMGPVVGSVNGMLSGDSIYDTRMQNSVRFAVSLTKIESGLAAHAKRMDSNSLTLNPGETRMARLAVTSASLDQPPTDYWTELRDKASGRDLVLIYVDRACTLRGTLAKRPLNLQLTRPGLHWLEYPEPGSDASVKLVDAPQVVVADLLETHISG